MKYLGWGIGIASMWVAITVATLSAGAWIAWFYIVAAAITQSTFFAMR